MTDHETPRVAVDVGGGLRLRNPVIAASGTFGYGLEFADVTDLTALGAIVVKGLSLEPNQGHRAPRILERLSPDHREMITLAKYGGYTTAEAATWLGITESAAKARLQRALVAIRKALDNEGLPV